MRIHRMARWVVGLVGVSLAVVSAAGADPFVVNEVVGDPQRDWSDSVGGDGEPFNQTPGSGAVDSADEFLELKNVSGGVASLEGFALQMNDASPTLDCFTFAATAPSCTQAGVYIVVDAGGGLVGGSTASQLQNVPAGGYVVLGNPSGSMSSTIQLVLRDENTDTTVDEVLFGGDAPSLNATDVEDESVSRVPDGEDSGVGADDFVARSATPGSPNDGDATAVPGMGPILSLLAIASLAIGGAGIGRHGPRGGRPRRNAGRSRECRARSRFSSALSGRRSPAPDQEGSGSDRDAEVKCTVDTGHALKLKRIPSTRCPSW